MRGILLGHTIFWPPLGGIGTKHLASRWRHSTAHAHAHGRAWHRTHRQGSVGIKRTRGTAAIWHGHWRQIKSLRLQEGGGYRGRKLTTGQPGTHDTAIRTLHKSAGGASPEFNDCNIYYHLMIRSDLGKRERATYLRLTSTRDGRRRQAVAICKHALTWHILEM